MFTRKLVLGVVLLLASARSGRATGIVAFATSDGVVLTVDGLRSGADGGQRAVGKLHLVKSRVAVTMTGVAHAQLEGATWAFGDWLDEVTRPLGDAASVAEVAAMLSAQAGRLGPMANAIQRSGLAGGELASGRLFTAIAAGVDGGQAELWQLDVVLVPGGVDARLERLSPAPGTLTLRALGSNSAARQLVDGQGPAFDRVAADVPSVSTRLRHAALKLPELGAVAGTLLRCEAGQPGVGGPIAQVIIPIAGPLELHEMAYASTGCAAH